MKYLIPYKSRLANPDYGKPPVSWMPGTTSKREVYENGILVETTITNMPIEVTTKDSEPKWLYEWPDFEIECSECGARFDHTELRSDEYYDGEDERWSNEICPKCGAWDCCEVKYIR